MTKEELKEGIINRIKTSEYSIAYFTINAAAKGTKEVISFHEEENNGVGGTLPQMLTLTWPDTVVLSEFVQGFKIVKEHNGNFTYSISELGL